MGDEDLEIARKVVADVAQGRYDPPGESATRALYDGLHPDVEAEEEDAPGPSGD